MRKSLIRKLTENRIVVIIICVIVMIIIYFAFQESIDNLVFGNKNNVSTEEELVIESEEDEILEEIHREENCIEIPEEEIDLVLSQEETDSNHNVLNESKEENIQVTEKEKIYVYITGEVNNPGVVILDEGSRIVDAINSAGGVTGKANISKVNLVYVLNDGMKVNIPNNNDLNSNIGFEYITMNSGDGGDDYYSESSFSESISSSNSKKNSMVNINTATQTELESLPGIGPSLALKIIDYRKENGKFSSIDEIKNVSGIGDSKFENLKKYITI